MAMLLCGLIVLFVVFVAFKFLARIVRSYRVGNYSDRCVFVTGCDSGFGHELAKRLDSLGCRVFAGCFTEKGETELMKICSERLRPVPLDVTNHDSVVNAFEVVTENLQSTGRGLWAVLNNAGTLSALGPADWLTADDYRRECDVNLFGMIDVTMTFLPLIKKTGGRVVNTASYAGRLSLPTSGPYCVSKFGVEAFSDSLRRSLKRFGCKVAIIEPSGFRTALVSVEHFHGALERTWRRCSPQTQQDYGIEYVDKFKRNLKGYITKVAPCDISPVVDAYEHALLARYPRARYLVGREAVVMAITAKLPEFISDWLLAEKR